MTFIYFLVFISCSNKQIKEQRTDLKTIPIPDKNYIYEMRTYTSHPGKLSDLESRFRNHTNGFFIKHGMNPVAYWRPSDGDLKENTLFYIIAHNNRVSAQESWKGFVTDPDWKKVYQQSREDGPLVADIKSVYMNITDYSPMK
tara:strand:- start:22620 stop:23048 length:429 start_codon:yes stop_codon:yes gene_type:complete